MSDCHDLDAQTVAMAVIELADSVELFREVLLDVIPLAKWNAHVALNDIAVAVALAKTLAVAVHGCEADRKDECRDG